MRHRLQVGLLALCLTGAALGGGAAIADAASGSAAKTPAKSSSTKTPAKTPMRTGQLGNCPNM